MARDIDHRNRPLTEDEKAWLRTRPDGAYRIAVNEALFGSLSEAAQKAVHKQVDADQAEDVRHAQEQQDEIDALPEYDDDIIDQVEPLTVTELRKRLSDLAVDAPAGAKKEELQALLLDALQDQRDGTEQ